MQSNEPRMKEGVPGISEFAKALSGMGNPRKWNCPLSPPSFATFVDMVFFIIWNGRNILKICWLNVVYYQNGFNSQSSNRIGRKITTMERDII